MVVNKDVVLDKSCPQPKGELEQQTNIPTSNENYWYILGGINEQSGIGTLGTEWRLLVISVL